jgi:outer membrane protein TolC
LGNKKIQGDVMNFRELHFFLIIIISLLINSLSFSQQKILTIDEAIEIALNNNRDVLIAKKNVEKSEAAVDEAFGYALPSVDLSASFSHFLKKPQTPFPDFGALLNNATYSVLFDENVIPRNENKFRPVGFSLQSFAQSNSYESNIQVVQTLFNSAVFRGIGASQIYLDLAEEDLNRVISETVLNVKKAFYGTLLTKQILEITGASYTNAQDNLKNVKALFGQGLVSEYDAMQAEVQVENIRPTVLQFENSLEDAKNKLKILLGLNQHEDIDVSGELLYAKEDIPAREDLVLDSEKNNYSIKTLEIKMQVDDAFIDLDRSEYWPSLYAFGNYTYAGSADNWKFQNYSSAIVGLTFKMNLFMGGQTKKRVEQSLISLQQTKEQLFQLKDFVSSEVKNKINELKRVESILDAQERNVNLAEKTYKISIVRYNEGTGNQLEIQNADLVLKQAKLNRLQSVFNYIIAKAELDNLLGKNRFNLDQRD